MKISNGWTKGSGLRLACLLGAALSIGSSALAQGDFYVLRPSKDNTLIEEATGAFSSGAGSHFYVGRVGSMGAGTLRRGVIAFDVAGSLPAGATIERAILTLHMSQTVSGNQNVGLHVLTSDWGEGTSSASGGSGAPSTPGDATWIHTFFPGSTWTTPGGDFLPGARATTAVGGIGYYTWSSPNLGADVQSWLDNPSQNFGWILLGNEATLQTAKQFDTGECGGVPFRPRLTIYTGPAGRPKARLADGAPSPGGTITPLVVRGTPGSLLRIEVGEPSDAGGTPAVVVGGRIFVGSPRGGGEEPPWVELRVPADPRLAGCRVRAHGVLFDASPGAGSRAVRTRAITIEID